MSEQLLARRHKVGSLEAGARTWEVLKKSPLSDSPTALTEYNQNFFTARRGLNSTGCILDT